MTSYRVQPDLRTFTLLARFRTPVSHHDPAQTDSSNRSLFLRRKQPVSRALVPPPTPAQVEQIVSAFPVPAVLAPYLSELLPAQFVAIALLQKFLSAYNGQGLLNDVRRYQRLEDRARQNAMRHHDMFAFWGSLCRDLQAGAGDADLQTLTLLTLPRAFASQVLRALLNSSSSAIATARLWNEALTPNAALQTLRLAQQDFPQGNEVIIDVPAVSANSIRHEIAREPGALHLLNALGLRLNDLPASVAAMLYNGGDLKASGESNAFRLIAKIRAAYPFFDLLGASTDAFILGESNLATSAWLVCRENAPFIERYGIQGEHSAFDLLDEQVQTRHANGRVDVSPIPYGFEALVAGAQVVIEFRLKPFANTLNEGALWAALSTYEASDSTLFGGSARGYGLLEMELISAPVDTGALQAYEDYLAQNAQVLAQGLRDGTLTTGKKVCS